MIDGVELIQKHYSTMKQKHDEARKAFGRPLTLTEKILVAHMDSVDGKGALDEDGKALVRKKSYANLHPDRVALQDATAQMALLQFMQAGKKEVAVPSTVHCDHLIQAKVGAKKDLLRSIDENEEVFEFLKAVSQKHGLGFWKPGAGIIHQVVLENYAFPGGMMIGTDSHTPNAGGLGMCAAGVGGADAVDVMAGFPWEVLLPKTIGVKLTGKLNGWAAPKDIILKLCGILTVRGGTNKIVEYFGPGTSSVSCTGKATICNMGAELGATCSVFPYDERMATYLKATGRAELAELAAKNLDLVTADAETEADPAAYYDEVVEIDLSTLEPHLVGPHTPDLARPLSEVAAAVKSEGYPDHLKVALIGSCTNSSYEDISRVASIAEEAAAHGYRSKSSLLVTPGSDMIFATIQRDGQMASLEKVGASVLANACGPCIGQWKRDDISKGEKNSIITSFNRNFPGRNDANPETLAFIASPEITLALGLAGSLSFNPMTDSLDSNGKSFKLSPPPPAPEVPANGFQVALGGYQPPAADGSKVEVTVKPDSERLSLLAPFPKPDVADYVRMPLLLKTQGKTTTDHISPAGPWLRYRGHLDKISDNMFTGAIRAGTGERGTTRNPLSGESGEGVPMVARALKAAGRRWIVVGDENYGEGSSREHAAMSPRHLGCAVVITRSFARIHESNLKKQGILPLTFANPNDWNKVREDDEMSVPEALAIAPGRTVQMILHHSDGTEEEIQAKHSCNAEQIGWIQAGGALNLLRH